MAEAGAIYARVKLDDADAVRELGKLKKKIEDLNASLNAKKEQRGALAEELDRVGKEADVAYQRVKSLKAALAEAPKYQQSSIRAELKDATKEYDEQRKIADTLNNQWIKLDNEITKGESQLEIMNTSAGNLAKQIAASDSVVVKAAESLAKLGKKVENFLGRVKRAVERVFVYSVILAGFRALRQYFTEIIKSSPEASDALGRLKGALLTLIQPLVNVAIPAFVGLVNVVADVVTAIASLIATLTGSSLEATQASAEALYNQAKGYDAVGSSAKKASRQLLSFDEINKLETENSSAGAGSSSSSTITPIFDTKKLESAETIIKKLMFRIKDVFFDWKDFTPKKAVEKIAAAVFGIAGAFVGWSIGGAGGAALGAIIGVSLAMKIIDLAFENGGVSQNGLLAGLITTLTAIAGGIIGFSTGNIPGAAIGATIGTSIGLALSTALFAQDGANSQEMYHSLIAALGTIVGGTIGFSIGGIGGAALGATAGAALTIYLSKTVFSSSESAKSKEMIATLVLALGVIAGGLLGFKVGGAAGAIVGVAVGAGIVLSIGDTMFSSNSATQKFGLIKALITILGGIAGGIMGFVLGGPGGAAVGVVVGVGLSLVIQNIDWKNGIGDVLKKALITMPALGVPMTISGIKIPGLASGAVIPPNREFLAVLGDQTSGTNIEAPLETIVDAFRLALAEQGGQNITIEFTGNLAQLARVLAPAIKSENNRVGTSIVIGG